MFAWETNDTDIRNGVLLTLESSYFSTVNPAVREKDLRKQAEEILSQFKSKDTAVYFR